jgi:hypothetical protein
VVQGYERQFGLATQMYLGDYSDVIPLFADTTGNAEVYWYQKLAPYVAQRTDEGMMFYATEAYASKLRRCPGGNYGPPPFYPGARDDWGRWNCYIGAHFGRGNNAVAPLSGPFYYGGPEFTGKLDLPGYRRGGARRRADRGSHGCEFAGQSDARIQIVPGTGS